MEVSEEAKQCAWKLAKRMKKARGKFQEQVMKGIVCCTESFYFQVILVLNKNI